jgi:hypothetical protein
MRRSIAAAATLIWLFLTGFLLSGPVRSGESSTESGTLSIYFMGAKVGYEDYTWTESEQGYVLEASGGMTQPLRLEVQSLTLRLSREFIPFEYSFKGSLNGMSQDVTSHIQDGRVVNTILQGGQETKSVAEVQRDALILPNPLFSPYLVLAKKYGCGLKDKTEVSAYMIPQVEVRGVIDRAADNPCLLTLNLAGVEVDLETDAEHHLLSLSIPGQNLKVTVEKRLEPAAFER